MPTIWSLGSPQFSPHAFPGKLEKDGIHYDVETADNNFWDGFQPGPFNPGSKQTQLPFFITFDLDEKPQDYYTVQIDYVVTKAGTCQLEAKLNDHRVLSYLDVVVPDNARELPNSYNMLSGKGSTQLLFPAKALKQGRNQLVLKLVEISSPSEADLLQPHNPAHGDFFGYGLHYSVIEFKHFNTIPRPLDVEVVPTPFYKKLAETGLCELLEARIHFVQTFETGVITISKGGQTFSQDFDPLGYESGELRPLVAVSMPETNKAVELKINVTLDTTTFEQTVNIQPCRQWTIHVMPHVHLDLGYTDFQGKVAEIHSRNIDRLLAITEAYPDYEFMVDGTWIIQNYLASRAEQRVEAIAELVKKGNLSIQAFYVLFLTGIISLEECYRAAYFAGELQEHFGDALTYANLTDVPTYSWAIPSVLAALGIPYFMGISNHVRAATADTRVLHKMSPIRWRGPDGGEVVAYFAHQYFQATLLFGDPPMVNRGIQNFSRFLATYDRPDYLPQDLPLVGTHLDNLDLSGGYAGLVNRWNSEYAYPHLVFSSPPRYFAAIEKYKDQLPLVEGDSGSFWEDGVGAAARAMAIYRKAQGLANAAETFLALAAAIDPDLRVPRETLDELWRHLIIGSEHTWTANHVSDQPHSEQSTSQFHWKETIIDEAARLAHEQLLIGLSQLGERITTNGLTLLVFNPHSWARTDRIEVDLPSNAYFLDVTSGRKVEYDVVEVLAPDVPDAKEQLRYSPALVPAVGANRVRFTAEGVPPCGYRAYQVVNFGQDQEQQTSVQTAKSLQEPEGSGSDSNISTIETIYYRVKFDVTTGAVLSCLDKENDRELLDANAPNHLGDYLYVQGAGTERWKGRGIEVNALIDTNADLTEPELTVTPANLRLVSADKLQNGWCLRRSGTAPRTPALSSDIYIFDDLKRIDVDLKFEKQPELAKEAVYVAFPFAFESPKLRYDRQQGWVEPAVDALPGSCNDWFTIQTAVNISDKSGCVSWSSKDALLFTAGDIVQGRWATNLNLENGHLYSYIMNNYWFANYPASQEGEYNLHYSFTSNKTWSGVAAGRFGREVCQPLLRSFVTPQDKADAEPRQLPPDLASFFKLEGSENIILAGIFGAQDNNGLIVRLQDIGQKGGLATVRLLQSGALEEVWLCSALERNRERISIDPTTRSFQVDVNSNAVITLRLILGK